MSSLSETRPNIVKAAKEIAYDNGMINRYRSEESFLVDLESLLKSKPESVIQEAESFLSKLGEEELELVCCESEHNIAVPQDTDDLLNAIFERG